ncbi:MAG: matrixin family metalloprotease [Methanosarcinales archaeon]|jgi:predicted Zn-dependent protease|nr:matrixin family metalloprotease [Methanosarcinales archaeon]
MNTWNVAGSNFSFYYDSSLSRFSPNTISFFMSATMTPLNAAQCTNYVYPNGSTNYSVIDFNVNSAWATNGANGYRDVETVALHELGHAAGISHSSNSNDLMWGGVLPVRRSLTINDKNALKRLY